MSSLTVLELEEKIKNITIKLMELLNDLIKEQRELEKIQELKKSFEEKGDVSSKEFFANESLLRATQQAINIMSSIVPRYEDQLKSLKYDLSEKKRLV